MSDRVEMLAEQAGKLEGKEQGPAAAATTESTAETSNVTESERAVTPEAQTPADAAPEETVAEEEMVAEGAPAVEATAETEDPEEATADAVAEKEMVAEGAPVEQTEEAPASAEASSAEPEAAAEAEEGTEVIVDAAGNKRVVRTLSVGQQVTGTVKRVADFGAFVDIGVGRDGLIHISELSVRRVGKVTDVLNEGQEVTAWIKKLDRARNRISLTLIDPNTKTIRDLEKGEVVQGTVTRILPYGAFVDIGVGRDALLHVREMGEGYVAKPEDVVKVGETIEARIIELSRRRGRVDLSLKGLRPEPEPVQAAPVQQQQAQVEDEPEEEVEDDFDDVEVLSPMELAFKKAMQAEGIELDIRKKKPGKRGRRERSRALQDEIIARTLASGKK